MTIVLNSQHQYSLRNEKSNNLVKCESFKNIILNIIMLIINIKKINNLIKLNDNSFKQSTLDFVEKSNYIIYNKPFKI